jgi:hypothetical protein
VASPLTRPQLNAPVKAPGPLTAPRTSKCRPASRPRKPPLSKRLKLAVNHLVKQVKQVKLVKRRQRGAGKRTWKLRQHRLHKCRHHFPPLQQLHVKAHRRLRNRVTSRVRSKRPRSKRPRSPLLSNHHHLQQQQQQQQARRARVPAQHQQHQQQRESGQEQATSPTEPEGERLRAPGGTRARRQRPTSKRKPNVQTESETVQRKREMEEKGCGPRYVVRL